MISSDGKIFYDYPTDFTLCFSAGVDSTFIACYFGLKYKKNIHLVTVDHGYGNLFPNLRYRHIADIEKLVGKDLVHHKFINIKHTFKEMVLNPFREDYKRYRSNFIWCLGCTLSLHTHMIAYNLMNGIPKCFFGSSVGGEKFAVMSIPITTNAMKQVYASYGIIFSTPLLDFNIIKPDEKKQLRAWGIWPGLIIGKGTVGVQPICVPGFLQHFMDVFFNIHPIYDNDKVGDYIKRKIPLMEKIVNEQLNREGVCLAEQREKLIRLNKDYL